MKKQYYYSNYNGKAKCFLLLQYFDILRYVVDRDTFFGK